MRVNSLSVFHITEFPQIHERPKDLKEVNSTEIESFFLVKISYRAREPQEYAPLQRRTRSTLTNNTHLNLLTVTFLGILK